MSTHEVFLKLSANQKLPTPSGVALRLMQVCHSNNLNLKDIANIIKTDPALSAELLKYANLSLTEYATPILSIDKATIKLGIQAITNLALSFSILTQNKKGKCPSFHYDLFWSKSLARAIACKQLAAFITEIDGDEVFSCGLLAQIGKLAFANMFPREYDTILARQASKHLIKQQESTQFGIHSAELACKLFLEWGLPQKFATAVGFHEFPEEVTSTNPATIKLTHLLNLAEKIAQLCKHNSTVFSSALNSIEKQADTLGIPTEKLGELFDSIARSWQELGTIYKIPTGTCPQYNELKKQEINRKNVTGEQRNRILIVDDDPLTLMSLERLLNEKGYTVLSASDGHEALQLALDFAPHIVITDWKMPKRGGVELCKMLRSTASTEYIYIIILTGREKEEDLVEAFDAGVDDYLVKPFTPKVLEARIRGGQRLIRYQKMIEKDRELIREYAAKLATANQKLKTMAMTDSLTTLPNRRFAMDRMREAVTEAIRHEAPLSCIMVDIDFFKSINDRFGHHAGDRVLIEVAEIFKSSAREYDTICRVGGEEFLIISSRNNAAASQQFAERLRKLIEKHHININNTIFSVTASFGIAQWQPTMANADQLIQAADSALYLAKKQGRNRVEMKKY